MCKSTLTPFKRPSLQPLVMGLMGLVSTTCMVLSTLPLTVGISFASSREGPLHSNNLSLEITLAAHGPSGPQIHSPSLHTHTRTHTHSTPRTSQQVVREEINPNTLNNRFSRLVPLLPSTPEFGERGEEYPQLLHNSHISSPSLFYFWLPSILQFE